MEAIKIGDYKNPKVHDFDVIKKVLSGEKGLYEILMRRNNQKLYRVIKSYVNDEALIKDVMQNTYIKAYEKLHQFREKSQFSTWLIRIGINEALYELKSNQIKKTTKPFIEAPKDMNPEKAIIQREATWVLEKVISELPEKYRIIYMLSEVENMKIKDISDCLNVSVSNVKVRIHRAKHMLKDKLYELSQKPNVFEFGFEKCDRLVNNVMKIL
ncbi:sigma-70 family RNA polymerase sigma factor [Flavivirga spongiicola]|uniref:Sigma-70 family RNA polymerase sigma factor n=1 Tax=Flavivirga spongiicola TaxID=421621 RepID=A0ABU7XPI9_9FLAO|nr:sigma-70 family RNA polymerase sigma factor [Flavivirga sp. MEBiC05379]MDO5977690.1 sigma-70 family RNA polymerase sigma factor [Flavivirga sp. MEBiC05379]